MEERKLTVEIIPYNDIKENELDFDAMLAALMPINYNREEYHLLSFDELLLMLTPLDHLWKKKN